MNKSDNPSIISSHTFILPFVYPSQYKKELIDWQETDSPETDVPNNDLPYIGEIFGEKGEVKKKTVGHIRYGYLRYFNGEAKEINYRNKKLVENYKYRLGGKKYYRISYYKENKGKDILDDYILPVHYIMIRLLPQLNAGFLIISTINDRYNTISDIKKINQYGRRIYNPFQGDKLSSMEAPNNLEIISATDLTSEVKVTDYLQLYKIMDAPRELLKSFFNSDITLFPEGMVSKEKVSTLIDDRMFVHSYIHYSPNMEKVNDDRRIKPTLRKCVRKSSRLEDLSYDDLRELYAIGYIDHSDASCQCEDMVKELVAAGSYRRWASLGSLYFSSAHSFIFIDTAGAPLHLYHNFQSNYLELCLMVLAQRLGLLHFSKEAGEKVNETSNKILELQKKYVTFKNQFLLPEVTAQEQGIEIYALLQKSLYVNSYTEKMNQQIAALYEISQTESENKTNTLVLFLTIVSLLPIPFDPNIWPWLRCIASIGLVILILYGTSILFWYKFKNQLKKIR